MYDARAPLKEIGLKIREVRKDKGVTLNDLAKKVGVTASLISQVERGVGGPFNKYIEEGF